MANDLTLSTAASDDDLLDMCSGTSESFGDSFNFKESPTPSTKYIVEDDLCNFFHLKKLMLLIYYT
jgi:hypothetical protein